MIDAKTKAEMVTFLSKVMENERINGFDAALEHAEKTFNELRVELFDIYGHETGGGFQMIELAIDNSIERLKRGKE